MTQGLAFLLSMLIEGAVAALLGTTLRRYFGRAQACAPALLP
jgi:hypothetical protein